MSLANTLDISITDVFSKYVWTEAVKNKTSEEVDMPLFHESRFVIRNAHISSPYIIINLFRLQDMRFGIPQKKIIG